MPSQGTCSLDGCIKKLKKGGTRGGKCAMHLARFRIYGSYEIPEKVNLCKGGCGGELRRSPTAKTGRVPIWCKTCQRAGFNQRRQERRHEARDVRLATPLTCSRCDVQFFLQRLAPIPPSCCPPCTKERNYEAVRRWISENPERYAELSRKWARTRRASLLLVEREDYEHLEIFERDLWICQLCFDPVDPALAWPHRMSATLDHKIPLSLRGPDVRLNAQLAHYSCNSSRSNRIEQDELDRLWAELAEARERAELEELALAD